MGRLIMALIVLIFMALGSIFGVSLAAGEAIKETRTPNCDDGSCNPAALNHVGIVESYSPSLFGVAAGPTNQLSKIDDLVMYVDKSAAAEGGVVEATFKIEGAVKTSENVATFYTPNGFAITLDADAQSGTIAMDGATYPVLDELPAEGRRLVAGDAPMLETVSGRQLAEKHEDRRRKLGFSGALMTSGSFTMMASTSLNRRQLSFAGALMTSGSFTMMASTSFG